MCKYLSNRQTHLGATKHTMATGLVTIEKWSLLTLRLRQNGRRFTDDILKCNFLNENFRILITISLKFIAGSPIDIMLALVQIMAFRRTGCKPLSEPMLS